MSRGSRGKPPGPFHRFNSSPEVIRLVVMICVRFPLSLRNVEDLLFERGIDVCHETVRQGWNRFGPLFAGDIRRQRVSAMRGFCAKRQEVGRWANNRVENAHLPLRRRERAMLRFRRMRTPQKFASVHANIHDHFSLERHLVDRKTYKERRSAALAEWQILAS